MTVLKRKKSTQWEKAQQRINVSPIVSRISRLVPEGKAAAVGLAFGESLFFRKLLVPVLDGFSNSLRDAEEHDVDHCAGRHSLPPF